MPVHSGACHCGAIGFEYATSSAPREWSVRACQCRFCRAHDALSVSDPDGELRFVAQTPERLNCYRFGLKTADFLLCRQCGVYIGAVIETPRGRFGIINVHALDPLPDDLADPRPMDYGAEDVRGRVGRREERWTPVTAMPVN